MGRQRETGKGVILEYLKQHLGEWISNQDLRETAHKKGLFLTNDVPRAIRQLRQEGWRIEIRGDGYCQLLNSEKGPAKGQRKSLTERQRYEVLARDSFRCKACGRGASDGVKLEVDHIIPVDWGGANEPSNWETLCEECNRGKKAWTESAPEETLKNILSRATVEARIEALFDSFPSQDIPSTLVHLVSKGALDWQRQLRRVRQRTGKKILPTKGRKGYRYYQNDV